MDYFDIVGGSCRVDAKLAERLGFRQIFTIGKELRVIEADKEKNMGANAELVVGSEKGRLFAFASNEVKAIAISDMRIDRKLMERISENRLVLCMPLNIIATTYGLPRAKALYHMSRLYAYAKKMGIAVSFISMAGDEQQLLSAMQVMELAKLVGADERYAKYSLSEVNRSLVGS